MASHSKVVNITNGCRFKRSHAERAIKTCAAEWVVYGESIRSLTLAESIAARNEQARLREPLAYAEIFGLRFDAAESGMPATRRERRLVWEAHNFVMNPEYAAA